MTVHATALRRAEPGDRAEILALLSKTLSWVPDELFERFFAWKHEQSPFGPSPAWVAIDGARIVGFRTFMRWAFDDRGGVTRRAVRAVDTATHPEYQGRHIFSRLTLHALEELRTEGVDFVFNTPNERSLPGYLKMGWTEVGRLATTIRPAGPAGLARMARARVPADRWSLPTRAGRRALEVLEDTRLASLLDALPPVGALSTARTPAYLAWRYGFGPLEYRALTLGGDPAEGVALVRLRRRGRAVEVTVCDVLAPDRAAENAVARSIFRTFAADYAIRIDGAIADRAGFFRLPGQGPMLTYRRLNDDSPHTDRAHWNLQLGDIELM